MSFIKSINSANILRGKFFLIVLMLIGFQVCVGNQSHNTQYFARKSGDIQIIGVFPNSLKFNINTFQCSDYSLSGLQLTQAMIYAIDELINNNPQLLPGIKIGWTLIDSCSSRQVALGSVASSLTMDISEYIPQVSCEIIPYSANDTMSHLLHSAISNNNHQSPIIGIVGAKNEAITSSLASFTSSLSYPQISYNSFTTTLNDRKIYPYFFRTTSPLHVQTNAIVDIIEYFRWNWVSVVIAGSENAGNIKQTLSTVIRGRNICLSMIITLSDKYTRNELIRAVNRLKGQAKSKVIVVMGDEMIIYNFLLMAQTQKLTGKTFIGTYNWLNLPHLDQISGDILGGAIGIDINGASLKKFLKYLKNLNFCNNIDNPWFIQAWYQILTSAGYNAEQVIRNCKLNRSLQDSLFSLFYERYYISSFVMDAVLALAHALHNRLRCNSNSCPPLNPNYGTHFDPDFLAFLGNVSFDGITSNKFAFRPDGSSKLRYNVVNLRPFSNGSVNTFRRVSIGLWNEKDRLSIQSENIVWNGGDPSDEIPFSRCSKDCQPGYYSDPALQVNQQFRDCCWVCRKCQNQAITNSVNQRKCEKCVNYTTPNTNHTQCEDMAIVSFTWQDPFIVILTLVGCVILLYFAFAWVTIIMYRATPIIKGSNFILLNLFLIFNLMAVVAASLFLIPISATLCNIQMFIVSFSEIGVLSTIICKTNQIALIFKKASRGNRMGSKFIRNSSQLLLIVTIELVGNGIIAGLVAYQPSSIQRYVNSYNEIELECQVKQPALIAFYVIMSLLCISALVMAFLTRKLPDNFNEAHYIFLAALLISCVLIISIPTAFVTEGSIHRLIVSIINLSFGTIALLCFISPKLYVIYFQSEMNTHQQAVADIANYTFNNNRPNASPMSLQSTDSYLHQSPIAVGRKVLTARIQPKAFSEETDHEDL